MFRFLQWIKSQFQRSSDSSPEEKSKVWTPDMVDHDDLFVRMVAAECMNREGIVVAHVVDGKLIIDSSDSESQPNGD